MKPQLSQSPLNKIKRFLVYSFPVVLYFSYYPVLSLPLSTDSMNLEFSLPLLWLLLFSIFSLKDFFLFLKALLLEKKYLPLLPLLFPIYLSISAFWSANLLRAILSAGVLWCIYISIYALIKLSKSLDKTILFKTFLVGSVVVCLICWLQCILDIFGVPSSFTLLCRGCTSRIFGFPHPSGLSIEPQFMGNLLLAPALLILYLLFVAQKTSLSKIFSRKILLLFGIIIVSTLFLTFSRGAIFSFLISAAFLSAFSLKYTSLKSIKILPFIILCFFLTLLSQGLFAEFSYTNDSFLSGIDKVVSQLSLGRIELGLADSSRKTNDLKTSPSPVYEESNSPAEDAPEDPGENLSVFSGYVEESTDIRLGFNALALSLSLSSSRTLLFGFGLGSAGTVLYEQGKTASKLEIIQNEYLSLLLETGLLGLFLALMTGIIVLLLTSQNLPRRRKILLFSIYLAFALSLNFFSGLPNALHIYLFPALIILFLH
ncbi:hypothetical protein IJG20_00155 [Candidatus Saccharibacteria bacterium]|nr:hypothetical protein [Candidatus Saccharibacteria bacterium]